MIRFWFRELLGLFLVLVGLYILAVCLSMLLEPATEKLLEAPIIALIGVIVFRGGIHLLKVAVAARIAMQPQTDVPKEPTPAKRLQKAASPWDW